jgi:hypothetical protein
VIGFDKIFYLIDKNLLMDDPPTNRRQVNVSISTVSDFKRIAAIRDPLEGVSETPKPGNSNLVNQKSISVSKVSSNNSSSHPKSSHANHFPEATDDGSMEKGVSTSDNNVEQSSSTQSHRSNDEDDDMPNQSKKSPGKQKNGSKKQQRNYSNQPVNFRDDENPMNFLHVRLGHLSDNYIKKMFKHGMIDFLPNYTHESIKSWSSTPCK